MRVFIMPCNPSPWTDCQCTWDADGKLVLLVVEHIFGGAAAVVFEGQLLTP